jgi:AcrR family transcriptional regulator
MPARRSPAPPSPAPAPTPGRPGAPAQGRQLRARGRQTRRRLLDAGIEVFSTRGYHAARVDDIVETAKTSHGTFYLYFANKQDLFGALIADVAEQMAGLAGSLGPITDDDAGRAEVRTWLARFTDLYARYGPVLRTWTEVEVDTSPAGRMGTDLLSGLAVALADRVVRPAEPPAGSTFDPTVAALALVAMIERFHHLVSSGQVDASGGELSDTLASIVHDALFGAGT